MIFVIAAVLMWGWVTTNLILAIPAAVVVWVVWVRVNPMTDCGWCHGKGKHPLSSRKTFGDCWNPRCQRGTVQRLGSKTVARAWVGLRGYRKRSKW